MASISLRSNIVPLNAIVIQKDNLKPVGWTDETSLYGKYIRGTPTAGTNPGGSEGAATHQHSSAGAHNNHTESSSSHTHSKSYVDLSGTSTDQVDSGTEDTTNTSHSHTSTSDATAPTLSHDSQGNHTHDALTNEMEHKTEFFLKHTETTIGLRRRSLGQNSIIMYGDSATAPARFTKDTTFNDKHIKGVAGGGSTPHESLGTNTHQHNAGDSHVHAITIPVHSHTFSGSTSAGSNVANRTTTPPTAVTAALETHTHSQTGLSFDNSTSANKDSASATSGQHPSLNHEAEFKTVYFISQASIGLRNGGIPPHGIALWLDTVITIPTGYQVSDGTNGTINMLNKYPKGEDASSPGTTGGSNTHQHSAPAGHSHAAVGVTHSHAISGSTGGQSGTILVDGFPDVRTILTAHSHTPTGSSSDSNPSVSLATNTDTHTHNAPNSQPPTILVSYIERLA